MGKLKYFKRFRMELGLGLPRPRPELPEGFGWLAWQPELLESHALTKYHAFCHETDAELFPCLATLTGCRRLMVAITTRPNFCAAATWLVVGSDGPVGTVQGLLEDRRVGAIQNLGVIPGYRGRGLGRALLLRALQGFAEAGADRAVLEATAANQAAIRVYRSLGFRPTRTLYRGVELSPPAAAAVVEPGRATADLSHTAGCVARHTAVGGISANGSGG